MNGGFRIDFATSLAGDMAALKRQLPGGFLLKRLQETAPGIPRSRIDLLLMDLAHPIGPESLLIERLRENSPGRIVLLASDLRQVDDFPLGSSAVDRVRRHPKSAKDYRDLAECLRALVDPDAEKRFAEAELDRDKGTLRLTFQNGQFFNFPAKRVEGVDPARIERVRISRSGYEIVIEQSSGSESIVPWDFVRHYCDPGYSHFRRKDNPAVADRVARNLKVLRALRKISSYDLALKTGIARPNIARIEAARTNPNMSTIDKLARALHVPAARLIQ